MITRQWAIRAQPPDPGAEAWCEYQAEQIERALDRAHGMQGAPRWYDFVDYFLETLEHGYPGTKESVVRNTWREERDLTVDEFEWGVDDDDGGSRSEVSGLEAMFCDECGELCAGLHGFEELAVCESCWDTLELGEQRSLGEFKKGIRTF